MQASREDACHSDLPEPVYDSGVATYKFSVLERSPRAPDSTIHAASSSTTVNQTAQLTRKRRSLTCWPLVLLYGLVLAIVAGVAGGFIGKMLERNSSNKVVPAKGSCANQTSSIPAPSTSSTTLSPTFVRTLAQPITGCTSSTTYNSFKARTNLLDLQYTTLCGQGWGQDDLFPLSAATPSDCVESCFVYNDRKSSSNQVCIGRGFVPEWWNQTRSMDEGGLGFNCFLKSNVSGIARNNKAFEVVALCINGVCDGISE